MATNTKYLVDVEYRMSDKASQALQGLEKSAHKTEGVLGNLQNSFLGLGAAFVAHAGYEKGKELFIGFNRDLESMRISAAAMLQSNDLAKNFDNATVKANAFVDEFQRFAVTSPVTTKQLFEFSNGVSTAVAQAGGGLKDIVKVTEQGVIAAKAFGAESGYAALEITEGIQRGATSRMRFIKQLVATQKMSVESFNALGEGGRLKVIEKALDSPAMRSAAKAFGESFEGVTSTLEDNIQLIGGRVGLPLFKAITVEVKHWNEWLAKNPAVIEKFAKDFGGALKDGLGSVKDAVAFVIDHRDALIAIATAYTAIKVGVGVGQLAGGIAGAAGKGVQAIGALTAGEGLAGLGVTGIASTVAAVIGTAAVVAALGYAASEIMDKERGAGIAKNSTFRSAIDTSDRFQSWGNGDRKAYLGIMKDLGLAKTAAGASIPSVLPYDQFQKEVWKDHNVSGGLHGEWKEKEAQIEQMYRLAVGAVDMMKESTSFGPEPAPFDPLADSRTKPAKTSVNVYVQQQVMTNDPDRFAEDFTDACVRAGTNPTQAAGAFRGL